MEIKDKQQLKYWLNNASLEDVMRVERIGLVENERFTEQARRAYILLWSWSDYRFEGKAGENQERFYNKCGRNAFIRRKNRALKIIEKIKEGKF